MTSGGLYRLTAGKDCSIFTIFNLVKRKDMPILSAKRQVTLPKDLCDRLQVQPGDDLDFLEHNGRITILKKRRGSSAGVLKHVRADSRYSDKESLLDSLEKRRSRNERKRRAA